MATAASLLVPRMRVQAGIVASAQRARGLDPEGSIRRRGRAVLAVTAPTVLGAIEDAEVRTLALEARGFSRPGPRTLLWTPRDTRTQRAARWLIALSIAGLLAALIAGLPVP